MFQCIDYHNALCPSAQALCRTEELPDWHRALVELGHRLINQRGPEIVRCGREPSVSPAFRVDRGIGASGERPAIPEGNGAVARAWFDGRRDHERRVFSKEPAM
jgi:hypothetical protein